MFNAFKKLFTGAEKTASAGSSRAENKRRHMIESCPDCGASHGELHALYCTKESCPFCTNQLITCDCLGMVLKLTEEEQSAVDEYIDDSVPPLSTIMQRWKDALTAKGRIRFESYSDEPFRAAYRGDVKALQDFLDDGFSPDQTNGVGYTALMAASRGSSIETVQLLLAHGAKATRADNRGETALHCAVAQPTSNVQRELACVKILLDAGADPNAPSKTGNTPLMNAAWFGCIDSAIELLRRGANPGAVDEKGCKAADLATTKGFQDIRTLLNSQKQA